MTLIAASLFLSSPAWTCARKRLVVPIPSVTDYHGVAGTRLRPTWCLGTTAMRPLAAKRSVVVPLSAGPSRPKGNVAKGHVCSQRDPTGGYRGRRV